VGFEWGLEQIDPVTEQVVGARVFDPHPLDPPEFDLILVGKDEGPVAELLASGETGFDHDRPDLDWSSHDCPPAVIPVAAVRRCAARLTGLTRSGYAPLETVLAGPVHSMNPGDEHAFYDDLAEHADEFRRFIAESAERGYALRCWMQ
jgi:hypothetical protein